MVLCSNSERAHDCCLLEIAERKQTKESKTWRTKIAHKLRPSGVSALDSANSVQTPVVFGVSLEKSVPSHNNEVRAYSDGGKSLIISLCQLRATWRLNVTFMP